MGGALFNDGSSGISSPTLDEVAFVGNHAENFGGAMFNYADAGVSSPTLTNVVFSDNLAHQFGSAMYNGSSTGTSSPVLANVTFVGNNTGLGGAMLNATSGGSSSPSLTNVTFSANVAESRGGAIHNSTGGAGGESSPTLVNVTFNGNLANQGGAIYNDPGPGVTNPTFRNVILWGDSAEIGGQEIYNDVSGGGSAVPVMSFSIVQCGDAGSFRSDGSADTSFSAGIGNLDADPLLGALGDNGGATPTLLPAAGSAAIEAGTNTGCPTSDQRGVTRPQGPNCDIGAVEVQVDVIFADGFEQD